MHFDTVFDLGIDYGASGGLAWDTQIIAYPNGASRRNQARSVALGQWQLGNRTVDQDQLAQLLDFFHAMRGRAHSFLYKDWNDYKATNQQLVFDDGESQLIKSYGLAINPWVREIRKPNAATVVIEHNPGSGWVALVADTDYDLDATTGVVTWIADLDTSSQIRWSGEFWVPVRFDRDVLDSQFVTLERRTDRDDLAYDIGSLSVVEEPGV